MPSLAPIAATFGLLAGGLGLAGYLGFLPGGCGGCCEVPPPPAEMVNLGAVGDTECPHATATCGIAASDCGRPDHADPTAIRCPHGEAGSEGAACPFAGTDSVDSTGGTASESSPSCPDGHGDDEPKATTTIASRHE